MDVSRSGAISTILFQQDKQIFKEQHSLHIPLAERFFADRNLCAAADLLVKHNLLGGTLEQSDRKKRF